MEGKRTGRRPEASPRSEHRFFVAMAIAAVVAVLVGFFPTYFQKPIEHLGGLRPSPALPTVLLVHGALMTCFFAFYTIQSALPAIGCTGLHKTLGWASVFFIPAILIVGFVACLYSAKAGHRGIWPDADTAALVNWFDSVNFTVLATAAIVLRGRPQPHKRLMLVAMINLLPAALARSPLILIGPAAVAISVFSFLFAGPVFDLVTRRRIHPAYWWGVLFSIALMPPTRIALGRTETWHRFIDWAIR
jgi:hypothetical protein